MAEPRAPLPIAFADEKRLSSAPTARALPSSHPIREEPKVRSSQRVRRLMQKRGACLWRIMPSV